MVLHPFNLLLPFTGNLNVGLRFPIRFVHHEFESVDLLVFFPDFLVPKLGVLQYHGGRVVTTLSCSSPLIIHSDWGSRGSVVAQAVHLFLQHKVVDDVLQYLVVLTAHALGLIRRVVGVPVWFALLSS